MGRHKGEPAKNYGGGPPNIPMKNCPFCGEEPITVPIGGGGVYVGCKNKKCMVKPSTNATTAHVSEAISWWNKRIET